MSQDPGAVHEFEARFRFSIKIPEPTKLSKKWISTIFNGRMNFGDRVRPPDGVAYEAFEKFTNIVEMNGVDDFIKMSSEVDYFYSIPNSFVYCMSKYTPEQKPPSPEYTSKWFINGENNIYDFGNIVSNKIFNNIVLRLSNNSLVNANIFYRLTIKWEYDEVKYTGKETYIIKNEEDLSIDKFFNILTDTPFRKRPNYSPENEVRFVFNAFLDGRHLPFDISDVLVDSIDLRKLATQ